MARKIRKSDVVRTRTSTLYLSAEPWGMGTVFWLSENRPKITDGELDFQLDNGEYGEHRIVSKAFAKIIIGEENLQKLPSLFVAEVELNSVATVYNEEGGVFTEWDD